MAAPVTKVEISVSCRNLPNRDIGSKSDPMCLLYMKEFAKSSYIEVGRTEVIKDTLNPDFVDKFVVDYYFEQAQQLRFKVFDSDSAASWDGDDFLGQLDCTLADLVSRTKVEKNMTSASSHSSGNHGTAIVRAEQVAFSREVVTYQLSGTKLDNKDTFGKSDPFLVVSRGNPDGSFVAVDKTEVIDNNLSPVWAPRRLHMLTLCNGDYARPVQMEVYDHDDDGGHDLIGRFTTTVQTLKDGTNTFELINPKKQAKKKSYKHSGLINVLIFRTETEYTFLDYIQSGTQINFTVAVDFTQSNGHPSNPASLHYMDQSMRNCYTDALAAVGGVLESYDSDKQFPALGFGGKLPDGTVSHEFFLNGTQSPFCSGIHGVLQAYYQAIRTVALWGPTNFSPVIKHVMNFASRMSSMETPDSVPGRHYFILLIITDGVITDMAQTKDCIVRASFLPMSIIIVGVGDADFSAMEELDCDKGRLASGGVVAKRDIVQFVPMPRHSNPLQVGPYLAKQVLAEVPRQFTQYMSANQIVPPTRPAPPPA